MSNAISISMLPQPNDTTCGPTCLHTIYNFYGDSIDLEELIVDIDQLEGGGTLGAILASHALKVGYSATIYTYNLVVFDPTWFEHESFYIKNKLQKQADLKRNLKLQTASNAYAEFLDLGGELKYQTLNTALIQKYLRKGMPLLVGLSATYLYDSPREFGPKDEYDDIRGNPSGHFVVIYGYNEAEETVYIADPLKENPLGKGQNYEIGIDKVINAILLGVLTYDANVIVITPKESKSPDA